MEKGRKDGQWDRCRIRALRNHLKLTQAGMAEQMGTRQQTISEWETGEYLPRGTSAKLLSIIADRSGFEYKA
jgi:DNA-binding transcriptional regulator YiaG